MLPSFKMSRFKPKARSKPSPLFPMVMVSFYLIVTFLGIMSYMYGSLYKSSTRAHNLHILAVDFDNDTIGSAFQAAYDRLKGPGFLTFDFQPASRFTDIESVNRAVCNQGYWGVVYTHSGATSRLVDAISGGSATPYNASNAITYVYNGVYYPVISESYIVPSMEALAAATTQVFYARSGVNLLRNANFSNSAATSALFRPIAPSSIVLSPTDAGARVLLNTVTMVVPPLMNFFFVMALEHVSLAMHSYRPNGKGWLFLKRIVGAKVYGFFAALAVTGFIFAFREDWDLSAAQFAETWMCFWFAMDISFLIMESVIGTIIPLRWAPFFIFSWVILNVTSTLFPFELNPGFYRWAWALPAHDIWWLLMSIWSRGCIQKLDVALPVLFAWWLVGHFTSAWAIYRKCTRVQPDPHAQPVKDTSNHEPVTKELDHSTDEPGSENGK